MLSYSYFCNIYIEQNHVIRENLGNYVSHDDIFITHSLLSQDFGEYNIWYNILSRFWWI